MDKEIQHLHWNQLNQMLIMSFQTIFVLVFNKLEQDEIFYINDK